MTQPIDTSSEEFRRICEARTWIRQGKTTADQVDQLISEIAKRRGCAAAEQLREDMRQQWRTRREWLGAGR